MLLLQLLVNGLVDGCVCAIMAMGFAFVYNTTRVFHIAHGAVYTVAAYTGYVCMVTYSLPTLASVAAAIVVAAIFGLMIERWVYRPLERQRAPLLVALLSSLGLYVASVNLIALVFGNDAKVLQSGLGRVYHLGSIILTSAQLNQVAAASVLLPALLVSLRRTALGVAIRAVRDDPTLATLMGINLAAVRLAVFGLGSALAGLAAMLVALDVGTDPNAGLSALLVAAVALIVGGVGSFDGAAVGGVLLGVARSLVVWASSARWADAIVFVILILFLLLRPRGIVNVRLRVEDLT